MSGLSGFPETHIKAVTAIIASDGTINLGNNVASVVRNSAGNYTVNFTAGFFDTSVKPVINVTPITTANAPCMCAANSPTVNSVNVFIWDKTGAAFDSKFHITAIVDQATVPRNQPPPGLVT